MQKKPEFGKGTITIEEAKYLTRFVKRLGVHFVLEFGPGVSTFVWLDAGVGKICTCEPDPEYRKRAEDYLAEYSNVQVYGFNEAEIGLSIPSIDEEEFDLGFVDSPQGRVFPNLSRINAAIYAITRCRYVAFHDTNRPGDMATVRFFMQLGCSIVSQFMEDKGITILRSCRIYA